MESSWDLPPVMGRRGPGHVNDPNEKVVYLVRHAESMENVRARAADQTLAQVMSCRAPSFLGFRHSVELLFTGLDAHLSPTGEQQLLDVAEQLVAADFVAQTGVELVVHSTRRRAVRTAEELFGGSELPFIPMEDIVERTPFECMYPQPFRERMERFCTWLSGRPESRIVVVGHGQFFRQLQLRAGVPEVFRNVEIRRCMYNAQTGVMSHGVRLFLPGAALYRSAAIPGCGPSERGAVPGAGAAAGGPQRRTPEDKAGK